MRTETTFTNAAEATPHVDEVARITNGIVLSERNGRENRRVHRTRVSPHLSVNSTLTTGLGRCFPLDETLR